MSSAATPSPSGLEPQYVEEPAVLVFTVTLNANQALNKIAVPVDRDADFLLVGINGSSTGAYLINFILPSGREFASSQMQNTNLISPDPQQPTAIGPPALYRAGSNGPQVSVKDTSAATNSIEIEFTGIRRLRTA